MPRLSYQPPRESYVPTDRPVRMRQYDDLPAVIAMYDGNHGKPVAIGWKGKANKPAFHFRFRDEERREQYVAEWLEGQRQSAASRAQYRAEQNKPHSLKVGQILYTCWGYDQTNIDYYEVTKVIGKHMVEIREVGLVAQGSRGGPSEWVKPAVGSYIGEPMRKRASGDNSVRIASYARATPWNGEAKSRTGFGWGH